MSHPSKEDNLRQYTREEVAARKDSKEIWLIIHNRVYNITAFLNEVIVFYIKNLKQRGGFQNNYLYLVKLNATAYNVQGFFFISKKA